MDEMKIKQFVAIKLHEGVKLTDIQTMLVDELGCKMTFLDLRLLAAELEDVDWSKFDPQEKSPKLRKKLRRHPPFPAKKLPQLICPQLPAKMPPQPPAQRLWNSAA